MNLWCKQVHPIRIGSYMINCRILQEHCNLLTLNKIVVVESASIQRLLEEQRQEQELEREIDICEKFKVENNLRINMILLTCRLIY